MQETQNNNKNEIKENTQDNQNTSNQETLQLEKSTHGGLLSVGRTQEELDYMKQFQPELYWAIDNYN